MYRNKNCVYNSAATTQPYSVWFGTRLCSASLIIRLYKRLSDFHTMFGRLGISLEVVHLNIKFYELLFPLLNTYVMRICGIFFFKMLYYFMYKLFTFT